MATSMTAWRQEAYGPASGTVPEQVPIPAPAHGQVLLRVEATALNAGDARLMLGDPLLVRVAFGLRRPRQPIRGMDVVGTVAGIGSGVLGAEVGERVVCELPGGGGLAEYACVDEHRVVPLPPAVAARDAACLPIAGGTAWQALDLAGVGLAPHPGRVLIIGASGGVGTFIVQLAALRGAEVWASCREENAAVLQRLGAARTLDHRRAPLTELPAAHFDAVIDIAGGLGLRGLRRLVRPGGSVVLVAGDGGRVLGPVPRMLKAAVLSIGSSRRIHSLAAVARPEILAKLLELLDQGLIAPVIAQDYRFAEADAALARVAEGHVVGKVVVRAAV